MKFIFAILLALGIGVAASSYSTSSYYYGYEEMLGKVAGVEFLYAPIGSNEEFDVLGTLSGEQDDAFLETLSKIEFKEYGFFELCRAS